MRRVVKIMAKLTDTYNLTRSRLLSISETENFYEVPSIGDENCAPYSFASGLVNAIKRNEINLSVEKFNQFYAYLKDKQNLFLLKERIKFYRQQESTVKGSNAYEDLADPLENIVKTIEANPNLSYANFKRFIDSAITRHEIAAMQVALGPAIRTLTSELHMNSVLDIANEEEINDGLNLAKDAVKSGRELIEQAAKFFEVNVAIYKQEEDLSIKNVGSTNDVIENTPTVSILHNSQDKHWNFLLPEKQTDGLASLPFAATLNRVSEVVTESANKLFTDVMNLFGSKKRNNGPNKWQSFVEKVEQEQPKPEEYYDLNQHKQIEKVTEIKMKEEGIELVDLKVENLRDYMAKNKTVKVTQSAQEKLDEELGKKLQQEEVDAELARQLQEESDEEMARRLQQEEDSYPSYRARR